MSRLLRKRLSDAIHEHVEGEAPLTGYFLVTFHGAGDAAVSAFYSADDEIAGEIIQAMHDALEVDDEIGEPLGSA